VAQVQDSAVGDRTDPQSSAVSGRPWLLPAVYTVVVGGNLLLLYAWWRNTPRGEAFRAEAYKFLQKVKAKMKECEGCQQRKEMLRRSIGRMHWDAMRIVEGEDVETIPEPGA